MTARTSVVRGRITIDDRGYEAKPRGGGKFDVVTTSGVRVGGFAVRGREIEIEDLGIAGSDPIDRIALLWARATLSGQEWTTKIPGAEVAAPPPPAPPPSPPLPAPPSTGPEAAKAAPGAQQPQVGPRPEASSKPTSEIEPALPQEPSSRASISGEGEPVRAKSICRIATHARPDAVTFQRAKAYMAWLRGQPGVLAAYLTHDAQTGKTVSVTVWENRDFLADIRHAKPPSGAVQLKSLSVDLLWVVG